MAPSLPTLLFLVWIVAQVYIKGEKDLLFKVYGGNVYVNVTNQDICIKDSSTEENSVCSWNNESCFAECSYMNDTCNSILNLKEDTSIQTHFTAVDGIASFNICSSECTVTPCKEPVVSQLMERHSWNSSWKNLWRIHTIRIMCQDLFKVNISIQKYFLHVERMLIQRLLDEPFSGWPIIYINRYLSVKVFPFSNLSNLISNSEGIINISAPQLIPGDSSSIPVTYFPAEVIKNLSEEKISLGLVTYPSSQQFQMSSEDIRSLSIRIELSRDKRLVNLSQPIKMQFFYTGQVNKHLYPVCHFFQERGASWGWKTDGCQTNQNRALNLPLVECRCDHATPFAVLMISGPIDPVHWQILSYISYVGCGLSAFFTLACVLLYIFSSQCKSDTSASIHVSLSGALFLLNASFLLSEWGATLGVTWVCVLIAAVMHYSLLCSFSWMALEALHLYLLLIKVFNTYYRHYLVKISILGWGVPSVIVGVSLAVTAKNTLFYGLSEMAMLTTNQTNNICWIKDKTFLLSVNLTYFSLVFLFSSGVLITVSLKICSLRYDRMSGTKVKPRDHLLPRCKDVCTILGLSCLLGTTWGLAFLSLKDISYTVLYLFSIFNSLQGFFIFLWMWAIAKKEKQRVAENQQSCTNDSSTPTHNPNHK